MFHVSNLKKCLSDESLVTPLEEIQIDNKLHFIEEIQSKYPYIFPETTSPIPPTEFQDEIILTEEDYDNPKFQHEIARLLGQVSIAGGLPYQLESPLRKMMEAVNFFFFDLLAPGLLSVGRLGGWLLLWFSRLFEKIHARSGPLFVNSSMLLVNCFLEFSRQIGDGDGKGVG
ncbi:hypothetical protein Tco_0820176 [Tanacetum coccineum]|uniref:Uncharacterized protein n=1 Tax=Tanacetum coccineum TaxID=301880 RepID=A0ABQ5ABQ4_9ASTR